MLGSAISRRWVVSLALVGLVSLFMATFSANWANPASATTGTTVPATNTPVPTATPLPDDKLAAVYGYSLIDGTFTGGPIQDSTLVPGNTALQRYIAIGANGYAGSKSDNMPNITATVTSSNTGCVTVSNTFPVGSWTAVGDVTYEAVGSGCSSTITIELRQGGVNPHQASFKITVNQLPATAVPTVAPSEFTGVATPPAGVDSSAVKSISPVNGGTLSVNTTGGSKIDLEVPGGATNSGEGAQVSIKPVNNTGELPPPPPKATQGSSSGTFKFGSSVVQITWYDDKGTAADSKTLNRSAKVCMTATQADVDNAHGGPSGLGIWRHNGTEWVKLNSSVANNGDGTWKVCAYTSQFSPFALGLEVEPPSEEGADAGAGLPATGDYSPNGLILLIAAFAGVAMVGAGAVAARRVRRSES